jgi:hypothetical protein
VLSEREYGQVLNALQQWAAEVPETPMVGFVALTDEFLTPRALVVEVQQGSEVGRVVLDVIEHVVRRKGLSTMLASIYASSGHPGPGEPGAQNPVPQPFPSGSPSTGFLRRRRPPPEALGPERVPSPA